MAPARGVPAYRVPLAGSSSTVPVRRIPARRVPARRIPAGEMRTGRSCGERTTSPKECLWVRVFLLRCWTGMTRRCLRVRTPQVRGSYIMTFCCLRAVFLPARCGFPTHRLRREVVGCGHGGYCRGCAREGGACTQDARISQPADRKRR